MKGADGGGRCVAKLDRDNKVVTEVMEGCGEAEQKRGRSWRHVQVLYLISVISLGKMILNVLTVS